MLAAGACICWETRLAEHTRGIYSTSAATGATKIRRKHTLHIPWTAASPPTPLSHPLVAGEYVQISPALGDLPPLLAGPC